MIKGIFLDFDGVIVESTEIKTKAFARLFALEGQEIAGKVIEYHLRNAGVSRYEKFRFIYKEILRRPLSEEELQALCYMFGRFVKEDVVKAPYVKGAFEFIKKYARGYKLFIISATPQEEIVGIAEKKGIKHFFTAIYGSPKQKYDAVREVLNGEKIEAQEALYIGDALSDFLAAKDNGVRFIARMRDNEDIFKDIDCLKVKDLVDFSAILAQP